MSTRWYPLYQRGNPQLRVFLPNFWMKIVKSEVKLPPNIVLFQTSVEMTSHDVRNYLEKIYNLNVVDVKMEIKMGKTRVCPEKSHIIKDDDYKHVHITLAKGQTFAFPDIFPNKLEEELKTIENVKEQHKLYLKRNAHRPGIPGWFSL